MSRPYLREEPGYKNWSLRRKWVSERSGMERRYEGSVISGLSDDSGSLCEQMEQSIPCLRCGECCREYQVRLDLMEARRIADGLGIMWDKFLERYTDQAWPGTSSFLIRRENGACAFLEHLDEDKPACCRIHDFKPTSCREWSPGLYRSECRTGLSKHWGLAVSSSGQIGLRIE